MTRVLLFLLALAFALFALVPLQRAEIALALGDRRRLLSESARAVLAVAAASALGVVLAVSR